jgi:hypothetical protein
MGASASSSNLQDTVATVATATTSPNTSKYIAFASGFIAVIFYIISFSLTSTYLGNRDTTNTLRNKIIKIIGTTMAGTAIMLFATFLYYTQNKENTIYFILFIAFIALGLSYASVAISAIR